MYLYTERMDFRLFARFLICFFCWMSWLVKMKTVKSSPVQHSTHSYRKKKTFLPRCTNWVLFKCLWSMFHSWIRLILTAHLINNHTHTAIIWSSQQYCGVWWPSLRTLASPATYSHVRHPAKPWMSRRKNLSVSHLSLFFSFPPSSFSFILIPIWVVCQREPQGGKLPRGQTSLLTSFVSLLLSVHPVLWGWE